MRDWSKLKKEAYLWGCSEWCAICGNVYDWNSEEDNPLCPECRRTWRVVNGKDGAYEKKK